MCKKFAARETCKVHAHKNKDGRKPARKRQTAPEVHLGERGRGSAGSVAAQWGLDISLHVLDTRVFGARPTGHSFTACPKHRPTPSCCGPFPFSKVRHRSAGGVSSNLSQGALLGCFGGKGWGGLPTIPRAWRTQTRGSRNQRWLLLPGRSDWMTNTLQQRGGGGGREGGRGEEAGNGQRESSST